MKKYIAISLVTLCLLIAILFIFVNNNTAFDFEVLDINEIGFLNEPISDEEEYFHYFTTKHSTGAVVAEFVRYYEEDDERRVWEFKRENVIYGEVPEDSILVVEMNGSGPPSNAYKVGERYLLFLNRNNSVFYDTARYTSLGDLVFSIDNKGFAIWNKGSITYNKYVSEKVLLEYFKSKSNSVGYLDNQVQKKAIRNKDLETVINECDFVLKVKVKSKTVDGILYPNSTYSCEIIDILKGQEYVGVSDNYSISTFRDAFIENEEYIIAAFNVVTTNKIAYQFYQAAENGVIHAEDSEKVKQVYEWLGISK